MHLCTVSEKKERLQSGCWQVAKCRLAHVQLEWCNCGLSSSASCRSWSAALCFLGVTLQQVKHNNRWIHFTFIQQKWRRTGGCWFASRHLRGGGGPKESSTFSTSYPSVVSIFECCSVSSGADNTAVRCCVYSLLFLSVIHTWARWTKAFFSMTKIRTKMGTTTQKFPEQ